MKKILLKVCAGMCFLAMFAAQASASAMCNTSDDLEVIITDSNLQEIVSRDLSDGDTLTVELEKGTEYYLKITADNQKECNYSFNILPLDVEGYKPINISEWGVYTINACEGNVYLYNYNYDLIAEGNSQHQISGVELNEGTYYVSVDGTNNPNVQITKEVSPTLKLGSGVSGIYPGALKSIYYSFEPDVSGWYVFSATGNCSMNGVLYSDSHLEISASNSNNYNGNFAMKQYLNAGETYYLKIESKYNSSGDYAIHVEKPLEILSIYEGNEL